uniref:Protein kinase domain-containing protein n=1 Tax=Aegilops tauschii subsp. strangulata TaxID=200361 RepID=A0A453IFV9_AEGTS
GLACPPHHHEASVAAAPQNIRLARPGGNFRQLHQSASAAATSPSSAPRPAPGADWNWLRIKVSGRPRDSAHGELRQLPLERLQVGARSKWSSGRGCVSSFCPGHVLSRSGRNIQVFSLKELKSATRNFQMTNCIGRGGFGPVYKVNHWVVLLPSYFICRMLSLLISNTLLPMFSFGRMNNSGSPSLRET